MVKKQRTLLAEARSWASKHGLHGPHAFLRFIMFLFVERLNKSSKNFVFKGGNLLWVYIKTPRSTVDLDFVTQGLDTDSQVKKDLEDTCLSSVNERVAFALKSFVPIPGKGASVVIKYSTKEGQKNTIDLDVVYSIPTDSVQIPSPLDGSIAIMAATMENIIVDKLSACHRFKSGNTRMKDYDDLWRIAKFQGSSVKPKTLRDLLDRRGVAARIDKQWVTAAMEANWSAHLKRNSGLPTKITAAIDEINAWLTSVLGA